MARILTQAASDGFPMSWFSLKGGYQVPALTTHESGVLPQLVFPRVEDRRKGHCAREANPDYLPSEAAMAVAS